MSPNDFKKLGAFSDNQLIQVQSRTNLILRQLLATYREKKCVPISISRCFFLNPRFLT